MSGRGELNRSQLSEALLGWYAGEGRRFPFRETSDPYLVLVSEVMLRRTTARQVANIYPEFASRYPSVYALARANVEEVAGIVRPLGLRSRAQGLINTAFSIVEEHGGIVPTSLEELKRINGVGVYAAGCVMAFCFGHRLPLIDVNTDRVISRALLGREPRGATASGNMDVRSEYMATLADHDQRDFQSALIDLSNAYCRPSRPRCEQCPLGKLCLSAM